MKETEAIGLDEYRARRERVLRALKGAVGIVFAGEGSAPLMGKWRPESHFLYLTGIENEQGAAVLFDPSAEDPKKRSILFLRPLDPEADRWDGLRGEISAGLRATMGFDTVMRATHLPRMLTASARRAKRLACLHSFAAYTADVSRDLAVFRKLGERIPGVAIEDQTNLLPSMRAVKSLAELKLMKRAIEATEAGYDAAMEVIRPGATELEIQRALERGFESRGARGPAYNSIVGSGINGTILHYMDSSGVAREGDLLVIDAAASYEGYAADVTRTYPVSGRFTKEQGELYDIVLRAQKAAIKAARPGAKIHEVDRAARDIIEGAGYGDFYVHGIGHQLGMEVHDATPDGALKPGMVITVEPGIYLMDRKLGIRIEDDVLITESGNRNLTAGIVKEPEEVEKAMARARR